MKTFFENVKAVAWQEFIDIWKILFVIKLLFTKIENRLPNS